MFRGTKFRLLKEREMSQKKKKYYTTTFPFMKVYHNFSFIIFIKYNTIYCNILHTHTHNYTEFCNNQQVSLRHVFVVKIHILMIGLLLSKDESSTGACV